MQLYDEFKDRRGEFEIVAFHDPTAKDLADLETKIAKVREEKWGGKDLPFPVVMDNTAETVRAYGVNSFPTLLLIDPAGNLVRGGGEELLRMKLKESAPAVKALLAKLPAGAEAVATVGGEDAAYALASFVRDSMKPADAAKVFGALAAVKGDIALGALLGGSGLHAKDPAVRTAAAKALAALGDKRALPPLEQVAKDDGVDSVRKAAAAATAQLTK